MACDDAALAQRARQGDSSAYVEIYERYQPQIYAYVSYRVADSSAADDLTAEVFVRMVAKIHTFVPSDRPLLSWLYTIASNLVIDHHRSSRRTVPLDESIVSHETSPARRLEEKLERARLREAIERLTEDQRQIIVLRFVEKCKNAEIAVAMNKSEGAIKSLQHRALATLSRLLEKDGRP